MKRFGLILLGLLVAAIALPPLWFSIFPGDPTPELPPAGRRVVLPSGMGLNVLDAGQGPPVVMIHGLPGTAYDWRETSTALAALGRRAIAYDRIGYGRSDPRSSGLYAPSSNATELIELLDALDLRDATVVGWSYGGATAMTAAMSRPERIGRLVLVGTGGPDSDEAEPPTPGLIMKLFYSDLAMRWRSAVPPIGIGLMKVLSNAAFSDGSQPDWWLPGLRANFGRWDTLLSYKGEMMNVAGDGSVEWDLSRIAVPTLLLHGDDDRLAPVGISRYLARKIAGAKLIEYPGASHMLPVTHADEISKEIVAFGR